MKPAFVTFLLAVGFGPTLAQAQYSPFQHVVIIVQENRTPDNLFQGLCRPPFGSAKSCSTSPDAVQYNLQTSGWRNRKSPTGKTRPSPVALANKYDLKHTHAAFLAMCDADPFSGSCRMDGAGDVGCTGTCPAQPQFRFVANSAGEVDPYLQIAKQYGWANYMFQTNQGPSFPAHQFLFGGTSAPLAVDDATGFLAAENTAGASHEAGCAAPAGTTVALIGPSGYEGFDMYPCFEHLTLPDLLPLNFSWKYYTPSAGSIWTAPNAIQHICESTGPGGKCEGLVWQDNVDLKPADVLKDINSCNLPSLSWVIPTGANSDHAGVSDGGGPSWVAAIVNGIGKSTACDGYTGYWNNTAILITWDDWGGWYDHELPTILPYPLSAYQYGFRVPLLFVSAYTPRGYISNNRHDFGSILRFVEQNFGIEEGALNFADARAGTDLSQFYDFDFQPRPFRPIAAPREANFFLTDKRVATDPDDDN